MPTSLITGWHDVWVDQTFEQYARLRRAGCETALLVGPWTHTSVLQQGWPEVFTETLAWLRTHLHADRSGLRPTGVRVHLGGADDWRDLDAWPADPSTTAWFPTRDGHLTRQPPTDPLPLTSFRYDPADPTPSLGGPLLSRTAGARDNGRLEDVNVCDGLGRLRTTGGELTRITVPMSATAHRFAVGHRLRWQISGGAHPRYARGSGTGDPPLDAAHLVPAHLTLHADSALLLPRGATAALP
ncbi:CocE/NonD family hydrolase C-terminal non-catalytic domain-containing protein, partial [Streptomyces sp. NPDC059578]